MAEDNYSPTFFSGDQPLYSFYIGKDRSHIVWFDLTK